MRLIDQFALTESDGSGSTVLWIHGYTLDSTIWGDLWRRLPDWHHVGIDLPGHGGSAPAASGTTLVDIARRIGRVAQAIGAEHLVALSFGGMVALQIAIEHGGAFASLTLNSSALGGGPQDRGAQARHVELLRLYHARGAGPWLRDLWMQSPPDIFSGVARHPHLWTQLQQVIDRHQWSELADGTMATLMSHVQGPADLRGIEASTLVLLGDDDMAAFKRCGELIRRAVRDGQRMYLQGAGHLGLLEAPQISARLLDAHMASAARRRPGIADRRSAGAGPAAGGSAYGTHAQHR